MSQAVLFLIRRTPERLQDHIWRSSYPALAHRHPELYESARLSFAPWITMELVPGDNLSDHIAFTGCHESKLTRRVMAVGRHGGTMIDIGANLGYFSLLWAASNPANRCIAFEASPGNVELLRRNVIRNGLEDRITVVPYAAGREAGQLSFDLGPEDQRGWGGFALASNERTIDVKVVRVDETVPANSRIAFLKVDTEGADAWALMGCKRLLESRLIDEIWFEENKERCAALGIPATAAVEFLSSLGYKCVAETNPNRGLVEWMAMRPNSG